MTFLKRITPLLAMCLLCSSLVSSQDKAKDQKQVNQASPVASATPKPPLAFGLTEDTPVKIKLARTMSSSDAKAGEKVDFEVLEDVKIGDVIVIQRDGYRHRH